MNDKEQMELAAKAAGYVLTWKEGACKGGRFCGAFIGDMPWRPKDDDGDALRLAVNARLSVMLDEPRVSSPVVEVLGYGGDPVADPFDIQPLTNGEEAAAVRLAIFNGAVKQGQSL